MSAPGKITSIFRRAIGLAMSSPACVLLGIIWLYRRVLSPVLQGASGPACGCRFHPTCSVYAAQAVRDHGALRGSWLALRRLCKCHPLHPGGFDPVPPRTANGETSPGPLARRILPTVRRVRPAKA